MKTIYPPTQKTPVLAGDECEGAAATVDSAQLSADNPPKPWRRGIKGTTGLPVGLHKVTGMGFVLLGGMALLLGAGCGSSPSSPSNPAPTPTPTPQFVWGYPEIYRTINGGVTSTWAMVDVRVNGAAVTNGAATLSGSFGTLALPNSGFATLSGQVYGTYYSTTLFTYTPNQPYTITTTALGQTASASATAPGAISTLAMANGAVTQASWTTEGNQDYVIVSQTAPSSSQLINTGNTVADVDSPYSIPSTVYNTTTGNAYNLNVRAENYYNTMAGVSIATGGFQIWDEYDKSVTMP